MTDSATIQRVLGDQMPPILFAATLSRFESMYVNHRHTIVEQEGGVVDEYLWRFSPSGSPYDGLRAYYEYRGCLPV